MRTLYVDSLIGFVRLVFAFSFLTAYNRRCVGLVKTIVWAIAIRTCTRNFYIYLIDGLS